ncbi:ribosomal protein L30 [Thermobaculum terrenum ATCC BAA-798]|uniref:Large ribosomal subunit protein uL30 n=1 Tax=Thermobaculum terrenum (strain ATCC BAA-798 / CCMEE 7001 / YNP1) TaxID=525904 RepID=D1CFE4_THET1|nr:50S ribosomal protein L30 [Thermobaculum terrenum]ACZ41650.1 ribosomal protein L30 [Thermobaculum terrenum ATCC BAA-798]
MANKLRITLKRSLIDRTPKQRATVKSLGLRRIGSVVEKPDTPVFRGMIRKVQHMVSVEEIKE